MASPEQANPAVTPLLRWVTAFETLVVFISGAGLFFIPDIIGKLWVWELAPFNARFMGTIYFTSLIAAAALAYYGRWSPARIVVPMITLFTVVVLIISILYFDRLNLAQPSVLFWFILYIGIPLNTGYHLWLYRNLPPADSHPTPAWLHTVLLVQSILWGIYGIGLLVAPAFFSGFWAWSIDEFHARMYSVGFLTPALGSFLLRRSGSIVEFLTLGITQVIGTVFSIGGVLIVDSTLHRVDWSQAGTWLWIALSLAFGVVGVLMLFHAQNLRSRQP